MCLSAACQGLRDQRPPLAAPKMDMASSLWLELQSEFTIKPTHAHTGTVEFPHNESVFLYKITDRSIPIFYMLKPLVLVDMPFNDILLRFQNFLQMLTLSDHIVQIKRVPSD